MKTLTQIDLELFEHFKKEYDYGANTLLEDKTEFLKVAIKVEFKKIVLGMVNKILERSPLKSKLVRNLSWLDPREIANMAGLSLFFFF